MELTAHEAESVERRFQKAGWELLHTFDFWFRRHFHLAPTDPRYLAVTPEQIRVEFWAHTLAARREQAVRDGKPAKTLEEVLATGLDSDQEFYEQLRELDERLAAGAEPLTAPAPAFAAPAISVPTEILRRWRGGDTVGA